MQGTLILEDGTKLKGNSFGHESSSAGEVVFTTGMVGYPESLTDPSYKGQILIFTYPLIGNYGVPEKKYWESDSIKVSGVIVSQYIDTPSHFQSIMTLREWLIKEHIPALEIPDTRLLTQKIRESGTLLGKINIVDNVSFYDPNKENLVKTVSTTRIIKEGKGRKTIVLIDCGVKQNIKRELLKRNITLITVPWNYHPLDLKCRIDGVLISNGPGDPKMVMETIQNIRSVIQKKIPTFGICFGNQMLALAAGGDTYKLKYGHRSQNQPCYLVNSDRCYITTQNHGFAIKKIPEGFLPWFVNANDNTNEGIIHKKLPFMSVQFHPEASPGPMDTGWIFDFFLEKL